MYLESILCQICEMLEKLKNFLNFVATILNKFQVSHILHVEDMNFS